jgi:hypothetical protein
LSSEGDRGWGDGRLALLPALPGAAGLAATGGALSYQITPAASPDFMGALMSGMVILMIPAFLICTGITIMAYRKRRRDVED